MANQSFHIPEIVNGAWTNKFITIIIPDTCLKCGVKRGPTKVYRHTTYGGGIIRAYCLNSSVCGESYEELRLSVKQTNNSKSSTNKKSNDIDWPKAKFEPWVPDTRVGAGYSSNDGMNCCNKVCNEFVPYAESNMPDGKFKCRKCRGVL